MKLSLISKYRTHIMGAAIMWVMWNHSAYIAKSTVVRTIQNFGFFGVDIFLLVSGLGLYFSMRKSKNIGEFYKKRAVRILPVYLLFTVCWYAFYHTQFSLADKVMAVLGINYFRGTIYGRPLYFDWFIPTLIVFYLLTPLYDMLFQRAKVKWKFTLLSMTVSPLLCVIFYFTHQQPLYGSTVRIAIFLVGYWIGWFLYEKREEQSGSWMVHLALLFTGVALAYNIQNYVENPTVKWGLNCYPALMIAPAVCAFLGLLFKLAERYLKIIGKILMFPFYVCGRYSLEIYLFHQRVMEVFNDTALCEGVRNYLYQHFGTGGYYFAMALISVALAAALHELIALVIRLIKKLTAKKDGGKDLKTEEFVQA